MKVQLSSPGRDLPRCPVEYLKRFKRIKAGRYALCCMQLMTSGGLEALASDTLLIELHFLKLFIYAFIIYLHLLSFHLEKVTCDTLGFPGCSGGGFTLLKERRKLMPNQGIKPLKDFLFRGRLLIRSRSHGRWPNSRRKSRKSNPVTKK